MGFWDKIKSGVKSAWEWVKSAIQRAWASFKVFLEKVANWTKTIIGALKKLVQRIQKGISNFAQKIKQGLKKFFLVITKKKTAGTDTFKQTIQTAIAEGKAGVQELNADEIFDNLKDAEYDYHIVQTDNEFNTEHVHSISADQVTDELLRKAANEVTEISFKF